MKKTTAKFLWRLRRVVRRNRRSPIGNPETSDAENNPLWVARSVSGGMDAFVTSANSLRSRAGLRGTA